MSELAVQTPWGRASELRRRKLHPGSGTSREEVVRNQRSRLFGAVVAVVSEKGYEATTVADVIEVCGVSRSDFYKHFANKGECLAAAAEALLEPALAELGKAGEGRLRDNPQAIFERFIGLVVDQPAAAQVCFVELHAAGETGEAVADRGFQALVEMVTLAGAEGPGERLDPELTGALVGGLRKLIHTRLCRGEEAELRLLSPELWRWMASVEPPPGRLAKPRRPRAGTGARFEGYTPGERIARAVARVLARKDYGAMSTDDIAAEAAISLSTFYAQFADKRDAVLAALEMSGAQIMALAGPAAQRAESWQGGVRALYEAICAYFAAEPEMARLATIGVYGAGRAALSRRDRVIDSLAAMLAPGFAENPRAPATSAEQIGAAVYALIREQARRQGPESLPAIVPLATYITLVGFVGPERALTVANGEA